MKSEARIFSAHDVLFDIAPSVERASLANRCALALDRTIYGTLLFTFVLFAIPYGAVEPWWVAGFEIVIFALTGLWMIEGALSGSWRVSGVLLFLPLLALTVFAVIQAAPLGKITDTAGIRFQQTLSVDPYETKRFALKLLALGLAGLLLRRYAASRRRASLLILSIIGVGIASAVFGLIRQTSQHEAIGFGLPFLRMGEGYAQFINRNHFAFLMEMTLGLALGLVVGGGVRRDRMLIYLAAIAPLWAALVLSNSRGGIFSMLAQVLFLALLVGSRRGQRTENLHESDANWVARIFGRLSGSRVARAALTLCLVLVLAVSMIWMGGDLLVNRLESLPQEVTAEANAPGLEITSGERRSEVWRATWSLIKTHPIVGSGFGAYKTAIPPHHRASGEMLPEEAHNDYLEVLSSGGAVGFFLMLLFIIAFIKIARERLREADAIHRAACVGALTGVFGAAVHSLVDFGLHITINALVFTALVAIATLKLSEDAPRIKPVR